jgi:hypothetical protein
MKHIDIMFLRDKGGYVLHDLGDGFRSVLLRFCQEIFVIGHEFLLWVLMGLNDLLIVGN